MKISAKVTNGGLNVRSGTDRVTVWLTPDIVDFQERLTVVVNGRRAGKRDKPVRPDLQTLLEDVRTRGDRQNPFWARVDFP